MPEHTPLFTQLKNRILQRLETQLSPQLQYHNVAHTRDDVLPRTAYLATRYALPPADRLALQLAALFHDTGYLWRYQQNEPLGAELAATELAQAGVNDQTIKRVARLIMVTVMPQQPTTLLEQIICDADLDSLGRNDFIQTSLRLRAEIACYQQDIPLKDWWLRQYNFLTSHSYFTALATQERQTGKQRNLVLLRQFIENSATDHEQICQP